MDNPTKSTQSGEPRLSKPIFFSAVAVISLEIIAMLLFPKQVEAVVDILFQIVVYDFGSVFLLTVLIVFGFTIYVACSKYGDIKFGAPDEPKQYSNPAWAAMMFAAGLSVAIVVLSYFEPLLFLQSPPFGAEPLSEEAFRFALVPDQFLYGFMTWSMYVPFVLAVAISIYKRKDKEMRLSTASKPAFKRLHGGNAIRIVDVVTIIGMIGGVSAAVCLGVPVITTLLGHLLGLEDSMFLTGLVLLLWTLLFGASAYRGIDKGIKVLSTINIYIMVAVMIVLVSVNPIADFLNSWMHSIAIVIDNFGALALGADSSVDGGFTQGWTVFYWAWDLTYACMMGLFVARISRGRTVREIIFGLIIYGACASMFIFAWFGSYAVHLQETGMVDLVGIMEAMGREEAFYCILETLPCSKIVEVAYIFLLFVFCATTVDSTVYVVSALCTDNLTMDDEPPRWVRLLWAVLMLAFSLGLIVVGGLDVIQTSTAVIGLPLIPVVFILMSACMKGFKELVPEKVPGRLPTEIDEYTVQIK